MSCFVLMSWSKTNYMHINFNEKKEKNNFMVKKFKDVILQVFF